jgi:DNA polymerase III subunit gamma/tau
MDKFIVSARKYRPQTFNTVIGQSHITTTLKNAIKNNQLAHAFLFCGPRGVGKTTCARILAKTINCNSLQSNGEACDTCQSCQSFNNGASLSIHELDAASNNSVDDIRNLVDQVRYAPQAGKYKVYIVDEVHMLSSSAFNAFLKTLEEPPSYAIFILATTEKHKILPTILSRCQIFDFKRITTNDTVEHLQEIINKEEIVADKASLQIIAQKSEGCMRDALSILDKIVSFTGGEVNYKNTIEHLNILDYDYFFKLLDFLMQQDLASAMLLFDEINNKGFEGDTFLNSYAEFLRNILVCKDERAAQLLDVVEGLQAQYTSHSKAINTGYLISSLNILNEAEINFRMARNKRLHVELTIIKLNFLQQAIEISNNNNSISKKKIANLPTVIKYKLIAQLQTKPTTPQEPKLFIETKAPVAKEYHQPQQPTHQVNETILSQLTKPQNTSNQEPQKKLYDLLKEKVGNKFVVAENKETIALTQDELQKNWLQYIAIMEQQGGKLSTINTFKMARLVVDSDILFTIKVTALTQQRFIEQEKAMLCDLIQTNLHNRAINFVIEVDEGEAIEVPQHLRMNSRQKFEHLSEIYPMLKQLKDRLKLDLDL